MKIKYETPYGIVITPCPFNDEVKVTTLNCLNCKDFIDYDFINKIVNCKGSKNQEGAK